MKIANKLQNWVKLGLITQKQAEEILRSEQSNHSNIVWKWMYGIAGLFIGLGLILIISANWDYIPESLKLFGDFAVWAGVLYGAYQSVIKEKGKIKELFLVLSFLFIGATIGLIAQIFNLSGGWHSFAMAWSLLGLPFVLFSRLLSFNFCWLWLFFTLFDFSWLEKILDYMDRHLDGLVIAVVVLSLISYAGKKLDEIFNKYTLIPKALQNLSMFMAYVVIFFGSFIRHEWFFFYFSDVSVVLAYIFAFIFFGARMFLAVQAQNMLSFKRNAIAVEIYIFMIFANRFGNLLLSGFGFIISGLAVLGLIYLLRKTSKCIKSMGVFHE